MENIGKFKQINEIINNTEKLEYLRGFVNEKSSEKGETLILGISDSGKVLRVIKGPNHDYHVSFLDASNDLKRIEESRLDTKINAGFVDQLRDGGTIHFPTYDDQGRFESFSKMNEDELHEDVKKKYGINESSELFPDIIDAVRFYKKTGGFGMVSQHKGGSVSVGDEELVSLEGLLTNK